MNNLDKAYQALLQDILDNGIIKEDRTGTGTLSVFGRQIRHQMSEGYPLLTTKKMAFKTMVTELLWFLRGDTNIKYLVDNGCNIWTGDAHKRYMEVYEIESRESGNKTYIDELHMLSNLSIDEFTERIKTDDEFAKKWGELGPIYGKQWRNWMGFHEGQHDILKVVNGVEQHKDYLVGKDQIWNLINDLKTNPDSRRLMVSAWNVGDLDKMTLPPCHYGFQVYTRELSLNDRVLEFAKRDLDPSEFRRGGNYGTVIPEERTLEVLNNHNIPTRAISLMWNQRSVDTFLGLPFNIASYGLLLEIIAKEVNMVPDELIGNLGDVHLYNNHIEQAKEQIGRDYTLEERLNMVSEEIQNEFSSGIVNLPNFPNTPVWSDDGKMSCLDDFGVPRRTREPYPLPTLNIFEPAIGKKISILDNLHIWSPNCFIIENYQSHPTIKAPLSN
jgi:thymidylate synthase